MTVLNPKFIGAYNKYFISAERHIDAALKHVTGRKVAVQAGGHAGQFPVHLAKHFEAVYTWEPAEVDFVHLVHNLSVAGVSDKVFAARGFLGDTRGGGHLKFKGSGSNSREKGIAGSCPVYRVDDLQLSACDLIYLDIQGEELSALHGASGTIKKYLPVIACEDQPNYNVPGSILEFLSKYGYKQVDRYCSDSIFKAEVAAV